MGRTIRIIGKAPNAAAGPGVESWGCNDAFLRLPRDVHWDRWFDVHTKAHIQKHRPAAWRLYAKQDTSRPIYLHAHDPEIPASVAYPLEAVQAAFAWGGRDEEFFTGSVDLMMAMAILEEPPRIELYGVDLSEGHERERQRNGAHYWIGIARGRGIDVHIPDASSLCKTERIYGYFTQTSDRNFASLSLSRFLAQVEDAKRMADPAYVAPGLDTAVA